MKTVDKGEQMYYTINLKSEMVTRGKRTLSITKFNECRKKTKQL
jgi:hypothetical protein